MPNVPVQKSNTSPATPQTWLEAINSRIDDIRRRAFELFEARGAGNGQDQDDWFQAEREVLDVPATEVAEQQDAYEIQVPMEGFEAKEIELTATPDEIALMAESQKETPEGFGIRRVFRRMALPEPADVDKIEAKLENGTLKIVAPKARNTAPRERRINVAA